MVCLRVSSDAGPARAPAFGRGVCGRSLGVGVLVGLTGAGVLFVALLVLSLSTRCLVCTGTCVFVMHADARALHLANQDAVGKVVLILYGRKPFVGRYC